jgi:L-fuculose-phosphate aldolase
MANRTEKELAMELINISAKLREYGLNRISNAGNLSVRAGGDSVIMTPAGLDKSNLKSNQLSKITLDGGLKKGFRQSSEWRLHTSIYENVDYVNAIVHVHPVFSLIMASKFGLKGLSFKRYEESAYYLGGKGFVGLVSAKSGTQELADKVSKQVENGAFVVIIKNHGTVGVGKTLWEAVSRLEALEYFSEQNYRTKLLDRKF